MCWQLKTPTPTFLCFPVQAPLEETISIFVSYLNMCKGNSKIFRTPEALLLIGETFLRPSCWPAMFSQISDS